MPVIATVTKSIRSRTATREVSPPFRWSVERYDAMIRAGILNSDDKIEMLEGEVVVKMPKGDAHSHAMSMLNQLIWEMIGRRYFTRVECPITSSDSEPEPDLCIVRGSAREFQGRKPIPAESPIIIEVADSSLDRDRGLKQRIYARAGYSIYWIVNIVESTVEVYSQPKKSRKGAHYAVRETYSVGQSVPVVLDSKKVGEIAVADLMLNL